MPVISLCGTWTLEDLPNLLRGMHLPHLSPAHFPIRPAYEMPVLWNSTKMIYVQPPAPKA